jgi:hypothetical protein
MAVAFEAVATAEVTLTSGTSITCNKPAGTVEGDVLLAHFRQRQGDATGAPSGWTLLRSTAAPAAVGTVSAWVKVAGAAEPADYTFTNGGAGDVGRMGIAIMRFSGVDTATPVDVSAIAAEANTDGTAVTCPTVTTTVADTMVVRMAGTLSVPGTLTAPSGTQRYEFGHPSLSTRQWLAGSTIIQEAAGSTGTAVFTAGSAVGGRNGITVALAPAVAGPSSQFARPASTVLTGGWRTDTAGTDLHTALDETTPDDNDYIISETDPASDTCVIGFGTVDNPNVLTGHMIRWRTRKEGTGDVRLLVDVMSGSTLVQDFQIDPLPAGVTAYEEELTGFSVEQISDYADLRLRFTAELVDGTAAAVVTWAELEVPEVQDPRVWLRPASDEAVGAWTRDPANGSIASALAERNDAARAALASAGWPSTARFKLQSGQTPEPGDRWLRARVQRDGPTDTAFTITLREGGGSTVGGGTLKGTLSTTRTVDGWATVEVEITETISNYADLYLEVTADEAT